MLDIFGVFSGGAPILDNGETAEVVECGGQDTGEVAFESQADGGGGLGEVVVEIARDGIVLPHVFEAFDLELQRVPTE